MAQIYVRAVENGISIFDMPENVGEADREQWKPLLAWAEPARAAASGKPNGLSRLLPGFLSPRR